MMEDVYIPLLVLAVLALPILLIVFMIWVVQLSGRVRVLEQSAKATAAFLESLQQHAGPDAPEMETPAETAASVGQEPASETPSKAEPERTTGPWQAGSKVEAAPVTPTEPAQPQDPAPVSPAALQEPPKAVVMRADKAAALTNWLKANWIYVVSAVSLAFAGLFFVQYGVETGLLSPAARVIAALGFGTALVIGGEIIRRRWGDREEVSTAYLPSVFSGAGIVTLFGAVLAALHLYALIGTGLAFAGLVAVAALAIGLGWYSGPLLAGIGILGAFTAPFLVGGHSDTPQAFYAYFAIIALTGLAIDAGRRWAWVSVLTLGLAYPAGWLLYLGVGYEEYFTLFLTLLVLASMAIPSLRLFPAHGGAALIESFFKTRPRGWPEFPTRLVGGTMLVSTTSLVMISLDSGAGFWLALAGLMVLFVAISFWAERAEALEDLAVLPGAAVLLVPALQAILLGDVQDAFISAPFAPEGTPIPPSAYYLTGIATFLGLAAALRAWRGGRWPVAWGAGAAVIAPVMIVGLEVFWQVSFVLGAYPWALVAIAIAVMMTALAIAFARKDESHGRVAGFALAAIAMIAFALPLVLTETALTLAFAVTALAAAALDRRFDLRPLSVAVQIGAIALGWRLILDPGLDWALDAPYWEVALGYLGSIAALVAALAVLRPMTRPAAIAVTESAIWTYGAVFASLMLFRVIDDVTPGTGTETHWFMGLMAVVWLTSGANQLWRTQIDSWARKLRIGLAVTYFTLGALVLLVGLIVFNPVWGLDHNDVVHGVIVINTLIPAYLLPALGLGFIASRFRFLDAALRKGFGIVAIALGVLWVFLAIRHAWLGQAMDYPGFIQPELYTYTIALLIAGAGLLWQAIARRSAGLRKLAMAVIGITVAKVFLVDMSGLVGLLRVFSFLALGLVLAGLAFLNRWAAARIGPEEASEGGLEDAPEDRQGDELETPPEE